MELSFIRMRITKAQRRLMRQAKPQAVSGFLINIFFHGSAVDLQTPRRVRV
jgi:hypothetical protein